MKPETVAGLNQLNRHFYRVTGAEFSATRKMPWPGWDRVLDRFLATRTRIHGPDSILDVGCGNGRFAGLLEARLGNDYRYLGVDSSLTLAAIARAGARRSHRLAAADVVIGAPALRRRSGGFDLVVAFGLFHHVPSWERRRSLLVDLAGHLAAGGILAVSFWQFATEERFAGRFADWEAGAAFAEVSIDRTDLERGDHLLQWGDGEAVRYCHNVDLIEAAELTAASGLERVETFRSDGGNGRLNLYHLLRQRRVDGA